MPEPLGTGAAENQVAYEQRRYHFWCLYVIAEHRSQAIFKRKYLGRDSPKLKLASFDVYKRTRIV